MWCYRKIIPILIILPDSWLSQDATICRWDVTFQSGCFPQNRVLWNSAQVCVPKWAVSQLVFAPFCFERVFLFPCLRSSVWKRSFSVSPQTTREQFPPDMQRKKAQLQTGPKTPRCIVSSKNTMIKSEMFVWRWCYFRNIGSLKRISVKKRNVMENQKGNKKELERLPTI